MWNFLFFTGYLKLIAMRMENDDVYIKLAIPNREVSAIYRNQIRTWFDDKIKMQDLTVMYQSMFAGKVESFEEELSVQLRKTISYMDNAGSFYHGFLLGIMANLKDYIVRSNRESGDGRYDVCVYSNDISIPPVILELKVAKEYKQLEAACDTALEQIEEKHYTEDFEGEGYRNVICYGIGFYKKQVQVKAMRKELE